MPLHKQRQQITLLFATFIIAICGLIYELLISTLSSYLLGDSVYQFSLVIGLFMTSMGIGAWSSRFIEGELPKQFVRLQLLVGLFGGLSAPLLFFAFAVLGNYTPFLFLVIILLGTLLGVEIPLVIRILKEHFPLKTNVSNVFTADYIGALIAALVFPLVLMPQLGLMQSGLLIGVLNTAIGLLALFIFREKISQYQHLLGYGSVLLLLLILGFFVSSSFVTRMESRLYQDTLIYAENSSYQQRLILTKRNQRLRFYINGALQFDSFDEYRYHESLVHPVMSLVKSVENILILGGGDGLAVRELLSYQAIEKITVVDLDPAVTELFKTKPLLQKINHNALNHPKVNIFNQDAWKFLENNQQLYDVIILDLPDPNTISLSRLYSTVFYKLVKQHLSQAGVLVTQATSPLYSHKAFWSINKTLQQPSTAGEITQNWYTLPYHVHVPSFGEWGFILASRQLLKVEQIQLAKRDYRFLAPLSLAQLFEFPKDMEKIDVEANTLSSQPLLKYYQEGWKQWYQ
jgi:spermidine synthase